MKDLIDLVVHWISLVLAIILFVGVVGVLYYVDHLRFCH